RCLEGVRSLTGARARALPRLLRSRAGRRPSRRQAEGAALLREAEFAKVAAHAFARRIAEFHGGGRTHVEERASQVVAADQALAVLHELAEELEPIAQPLALALLRRR